MNATDPSLQNFQTDIDKWMSENVPKNPGFLLPLTFLEVGTEQQLDFLREWQHTLWSAGFLGMHWPTEYGGQGADPAYQGIVDKALGAHNAPIIFNTIGLNWTGPLLLDVGTEEDRQRYVKNILTGEEIWCQLFSEPAGGSDLAALRTKAEKDGDDWIINGQKIWTSQAHYADYGIVVTRTDPTVAKHKGLTMFIVDMKMPGIGGLEATRRIKAACEHSKIVVLSGCTDTPFAQRVLSAGATAYVSKSSHISEIIKAIKMVDLGERYLSADIAQNIALNDSADPFADLSSREMQIASMIIDCRKVQDISDALCLSPKTVNTYRYRIFEKLKIEEPVSVRSVEADICINHPIINRLNRSAKLIQSNFWVTARPAFVIIYNNSIIFDRIYNKII